MLVLLFSVVKGQLALVWWVGLEQPGATSAEARACYATLLPFCRDDVLLRFLRCGAFIVMVGGVDMGHLAR
jgi:hypothetical protein